MVQTESSHNGGGDEDVDGDGGGDEDGATAACERGASAASRTREKGSSAGAASVGGMVGVVMERGGRRVGRRGVNDGGMRGEG